VFVSTMTVLLAGDQGDVAQAGVVGASAPPSATAAAPSSRPPPPPACWCSSCSPCSACPLAVTRRETGGWRWAALQLGYMSGLAYVAAFAVYHGLRAWGVA
jgi:ferrous iron transport protein B